MAVVLRNISSCTSGDYVTNFGELPVIGNQVYYLTFNGDTPGGCFTVGSITTSPTTINSVASADSFVNSCPDCLNATTQTPTPTVTQTNTPTPSVTPTNTVTPTVTQTPTRTVTPTVTPTNTATPSVTPSITPTRTVTPTVTPTNTPTNTQTPTPSLSGFALTGGTTNTQGGTIVYEDCITCSGDTFTQALPHAIYSNAQGRSVVQVDSVALGGFNGLNS